MQGSQAKLEAAEGEKGLRKQGSEDELKVQLNKIERQSSNSSDEESKNLKISITRELIREQKRRFKKEMQKKQPHFPSIFHKIQQESKNKATNQPA